MVPPETRAGSITSFTKNLCCMGGVTVGTGSKNSMVSPLWTLLRQLFVPIDQNELRRHIRQQEAERCGRSYVTRSDDRLLFASAHCRSSIRDWRR
jgi:hypothetical protein